MRETPQHEGALRVEGGVARRAQGAGLGLGGGGHGVGAEESRDEDIVEMALPPPLNKNHANLGIISEVTRSILNDNIFTTRSILRVARV